MLEGDKRRGGRRTGVQRLVRKADDRMFNSQVVSSTSPASSSMPKRHHIIALEDLRGQRSAEPYGYPVGGRVVSLTAGTSRNRHSFGPTGLLTSG